MEYSTFLLYTKTKTKKNVAKKIAFFIINYWWSKRKSGVVIFMSYVCGVAIKECSGSGPPEKLIVEMMA